MAYQRPPPPHNRRTNPARRPIGLSRESLQPTDPTRHGPLSPPTPYPPSAQSEHSLGPDSMDIDYPLPEFNPVTNNPPATGSTTRAPGVHRHTFEVDLSSRLGGMSDYEVLDHARTQLGFLERSNLAEGSMRRIRDCRMRLRIDIDTRSASRAAAVVDVRMRMLAMQDMISDGLGWFPGLPWRHARFTVEVVYC